MDKKNWLIWIELSWLSYKFYAFFIKIYNLKNKIKFSVTLL